MIVVALDAFEYDAQAREIRHARVVVFADAFDQAREGAGFYMGFSEASDMGAIERASAAHGAGITIDRPEARPPALNSDQLWLHPPSLGGMMLGVSRPTMAWKWSGHPERVERIDA